MVALIFENFKLTMIIVLIATTIGLSQFGSERRN
jgi:hypothetical protein